MYLSCAIRPASILFLIEGGLYSVTSILVHTGKYLDTVPVARNHIRDSNAARNRASLKLVAAKLLGPVGSTVKVVSDLQINFLIVGGLYSVTGNRAAEKQR